MEVGPAHQPADHRPGSAEVTGHPPHRLDDDGPLPVPLRPGHWVTLPASRSRSNSPSRTPVTNVSHSSPVKSRYTHPSIWFHHLIPPFSGTIVDTVSPAASRSRSHSQNPAVKVRTGPSGSFESRIRTLSWSPLTSTHAPASHRRDRLHTVIGISLSWCAVPGRSRPSAAPPGRRSCGSRRNVWLAGGTPRGPCGTIRTGRRRSGGARGGSGCWWSRRRCPSAGRADRRQRPAEQRHAVGRQAARVAAPSERVVRRFRLCHHLVRHVVHEHLDPVAGCAEHLVAVLHRVPTEVPAEHLPVHDGRDDDNDHLVDLLLC